MENQYESPSFLVAQRRALADLEPEAPGVHRTLQGGRAGKSDEAGVSYIFLPEGGPKLFDAKFKSVLGNEIRVVGMENVEGAWVLQEWSCEILAVK